MHPPPLKAGDTIGIMAPSSRTDRATIAAARKKLEALGFKVRVHDQTFTVDRQSAGSAQQKTDALHALWADPEVKAIFAARGGNRAGYMLEQLDFDLIKKNPKILLGFSDVTALLNAIYKHTGLTTYHGPMMHNFAKGMEETQIRQCFNLLAGSETDLPTGGAYVIRPGKAQGRLIGGNLSLFASLVGTPHMPDMNGAILFLEDCDDEISRFDRMLLQLRNAGVFDQISGLVIGNFTNMLDTGPNYFGFNFEEVLREATAGKDFPIIMNAPFGHGKDLATYPVGATAALDAGRKPPTLKLTGKPGGPAAG